jgi:hypothetical protein
MLGFCRGAREDLIDDPDPLERSADECSKS